MESLEPLNRRVKRARKLVLKMTQKQFVAHAQEKGVKIHLSTFQKLESGHLPYIADETLAQLAELLHIEKNELVSLKEKGKDKVSARVRKFEGAYLKVSYSHSALDMLSVEVVKIQYEPDLRDLRVYINHPRYQYMGTLEKREHLLYFALEEAGGVERLNWLMRDDVGLHIEVLWGVCIALTPSGTPYAYKAALFKSLTGEIPARLLKNYALKDEERYCSKLDIFIFFEYMFKNKNISIIYQEKLLQYLNSTSPGNPNMLFTREF